jgi:hypothetical protein
MKIKLDFVTNSSSTSYLICVPDNWQVPSDEDIMKACEYVEQDLGYTEIDKLVESVRDALEEIKEAKDYVTFTQTENESIYYSIIESLGSDAVILLDTYAPDYEGVIHVIPKSMVDDWYTQLNLKKIEL